MKTLISLVFAVAIGGSAIAKPLDAAGPLERQPTTHASAAASEQLAFWWIGITLTPRFCWDSQQGTHAC